MSRMQSFRDSRATCSRATPRAMPSSRAAFATFARIAFVATACAWIFILSPAYGGEQACEMSWMHPKFARVPDVALASSTHALYRYEDAVHDATNASSPAPSCVVAALFVPGTGGGYKQVRSVGSASSSEARRRSTASASCDVRYYAVHFAEELSIYNARIMRRQGESVRRALRAVKALEFGDELSLSRVVVVGHSAGALAAADAIADIHHEFADVTALALAAPLAWNPVALTRDARAFGMDIERRWRASGAASVVGLVSVAGGVRDRQVSSLAMASVDALVGGNVYRPHVARGAAFAERADALTAVGVSTDHRCAMWCKQLMTAASRGLLDAFPSPPPQVDTASSAAHARVRALANALGYVESNDARPRRRALMFGLNARAFEVVQERGASALAGVVAHAFIEPTFALGCAFALISTMSSPMILRDENHRVESVVASFVLYATSAFAARRALGPKRQRERVVLAACGALAQIPSLIAWGQCAFAHVVFAFPSIMDAARAAVPPMTAADALACAVVGVSMVVTPASYVAPPRALVRALGWTLAAIAAAPGRVGDIVIPIAVAHGVAAIAASRLAVRCRAKRE